ncbi:hypothetical protein PAE9249_05358 [Paenibacillus sp. CECT 9249]|uniref:copper amine oxidase N-terminal domain-containing protein n=1 Tax=Paenibacillus sp. CECT 9249 TaxID=2845385 RepID=UPI001E539A6D|nr:copper amine oxidase N-terminal domain-containing protein [Paenibacillus sp. CECT 9249]CAH0122767.1 hypothetical protein PAE9249_05358 [Paenibacillus sp. CECT 9249]
MKNRFLSIMFASAVAVSSLPLTVNAAGNQAVIIKVNGNTVNSYEAPAYIDTNSQLTYVPLRFISEALGAKVEWVSNDQPITATIDEPEHNEVKVLLNSKKVEKNGKVSTIEGAPVLQNGRTMVPLRVISEGLGADVKWVSGSNGQNNVVEINTPWETPVPESSVTWTPVGNQKEVAQKIFKGIDFDSSNKTLKINVPSIEGKRVVASVIEGENQRKGKSTVLKTDTIYNFSNLGEFSINIVIYEDNDLYGETSVFDSYFIYTQKIAESKLKKSFNTDLTVIDQYQNIVPMSAVYKALGISN